MTQECAAVCLTSFELFTSIVLKTIGGNAPLVNVDTYV